VLFHESRRAPPDLGLFQEPGSRAPARRGAKVFAPPVLASHALRGACRLFGGRLSAPQAFRNEGPWSPRL